MMGFLLLATASRLAVVPTQAPIQWVTGALVLGVNQAGHKADHLSPSSEIKNVWSYTSTPPMPLHGMVFS